MKATIKIAASDKFSHTEQEMDVELPAYVTVSALGHDEPISIRIDRHGGVLVNMAPGVRRPSAGSPSSPSSQRPSPSSQRPSPSSGRATTSVVGMRFVDPNYTPWSIGKSSSARSRRFSKTSRNHERHPHRDRIRPFRGDVLHQRHQPRHQLGDLETTMTTLAIYGFVMGVVCGWTMVREPEDR